ncbi:putative membrane protein [Streptomyces himastatinicus ATCC 53653]|uniref:Putative membrane protein n=1 Tax=Streptomyces himastatinicus ATCC 53653 TaxID=457427 RepID=D9WEV8_9ACTN|nr:XRE family transcriptional regulator [Streptomyces himastatinicus]EFL25323.1 putative membrane protein [Streptomyces himastatinicus ATCC 53653]
MPRWRDLPEELDPQVREFTGQLRGLVDRSGLSVVAIADRTGYSKTSWERYLGGRLLPPQGAVEALAEATGADAGHLGILWELAERAWSRAEMRHDHTMEAIRVDRARAALEEFAPPPAEKEKKNGRKSAKSRPATAAPAVGQNAQPSQEAPADQGTRTVQGVDVPEPEQPLVEPVPASSSRAWPTLPVPDAAPAPPVSSAPPASPTPPVPPAADEPGPPRPAPGPRRRIALFAGGVVGTLLIVAGAVLLAGQGGDDEKRAHKPVKSPATTASRLPAGVKCSGNGCAGKDPQAMGCGGKYARTAANAMVGTAYIEVRYSKVCGAAWARIAQAAPGDLVEVGAPAKGGGQNRTERGKVDADGDAYTRMVTADATSRATACATLTGGQRGCTPKEGTP